VGEHEGKIKDGSEPQGETPRLKRSLVSHTSSNRDEADLFHAFGGVLEMNVQFAGSSTKRREELSYYSSRFCGRMGINAGLASFVQCRQ
jgi:hypothetical protein